MQRRPRRISITVSPSPGRRRCAQVASECQWSELQSTHTMGGPRIYALGRRRVSANDGYLVQGAAARSVGWDVRAFRSNKGAMGAASLAQRRQRWLPMFESR